MANTQQTDLYRLFAPDRGAHILIVGDVILDRYVHGDTTRVSPEAPVPVVRVKHTEDRPGGAGNVALNVSKLGIKCCLIGITGKDSTADILETQLVSSGVICRFVCQHKFPTITKLRVLSQHQQLLRLDYESPANTADTGALEDMYTKEIGHADIVILSDYAKGSLANVQTLIKIAREHGKKVLVDPKGTDFDRYRGASLLTPNAREFEAVVGNCANQEVLVERGNNLCRSLALEALLITQGEHGMTLIRKDDTPVYLTTEALEVFDVTGAGDTVIATMACALASNYDLSDSTMFANRAAGIVVGKLGANPVSINELNKAALSLHLDGSNIVNETQLKLLVENVKSEGKTIVMTNGCFDILHAGHVNFLQQASKLGDYLVIAVNDDDSVKRLKGADRPINRLEHRLVMLSSLNMVDWVIAFSEDTPERLICEIHPDVLVKGGDYGIDEIAGSECVKKNGGDVKILPLLEGFSTTELVNSLKKLDL